MSAKSFLTKQTFNPGLVGILINPFFFARKNLFANIKANADYLHGRVLDVGCGKKPYKELFKRTTEYIGMDIDNPGHDHSNESIDVFYDGNVFPFPPQSFDSVLTNQVFEHVFNPAHFINEIHRVLKPGGYILLTVPFSWDEHEQPFDFARYSSFGIRHILQENGFEVVNHVKSTRGLTAIIQLFIGYLYKLFYTRNRLVNIFGTFVFLSPITIVGGLISLVAPRSEDFYLDNIVLARKKNT